MSEEQQATESQEAKTEEKKLPAPPVELIALDEKGLFVPKTESQFKRLVSYVLKSGMAPKQLDTPEKIMIAMQYCASYGMDPVRGLRRVYIVNGTPSFWGETPLTLVMQGGNLLRIHEFLIDKQYKEINVENKNLDADVYGAVCRTWRRDEVMERIEIEKLFNEKLTPELRDSILAATMHETHFTVDDAVKAGLWNNSGKLYGKYPKDMLKYRARSRNLLDNFANDVQGMNMLEHHFPEELNRVEDYRDVTAHSHEKQLMGAKALNEELAGEDGGDDVQAEA